MQDEAAFASRHNVELPALLRQLGGSLLVSTYDSDRVVLLRANDDELDVHLVHYPAPMGLALAPGRLALGGAAAVWELRDQPAALAAASPRPDAVFVPQRQHRTGDVRVHELAYGRDGLWLVATRFNCLATLDAEHSFVPRWVPPFVADARAEDACHLNGVAMREGAPAFVTALGARGEPGGWRERRIDGGVLVEVASGRVLRDGLCMPHSPRWHQDALWLLESGRGALCRIDPRDGRSTTVARVPGFARGLALVGDVAFVGVSQVRYSAWFGGLPITAEGVPRECGVWALDLRDGRPLGLLHFVRGVEELFDLQWLPRRWPELLEADAPAALNAFALPSHPAWRDAAE